jgi:hypothetical protein
VQNIDHFRSWIKCISNTPSPATDSILLAGVETLFNLDILRSIQDTKDPFSEIPLFHTLSALSQSDRHTTLESLPKLLSHYVAALRKYKGSIFSGSSGPNQQKPDINSAALDFFAFSQSLLDSEDRDSHTWSIACRLLKVVEEEHLHFTREDTSGSVLLAKSIELALTGLRECYIEENGELARNIVDCMSTLVRIDCDLVLPSTPQILARLLCVCCPPVYQTFLLTKNIRFRLALPSTLLSSTSFWIITSKLALLISTSRGCFRFRLSPPQ